MSRLRVLGVMTGTSCDGLDASCLEFSGSPDNPRWKALWTVSSPYPSKLRERTLALQQPAVRAPIRDWLELDATLGEWFGRELARLIASTRIKPDVIANHGQTAAHFPPAGTRRVARGKTLQLGDPTRIAAATGLTVISNFRDGDLSAGGQGAPLVPLFHRALAARSGRPDGIAIHNIGGISNLTYFSRKGPPLAFDTGPGNIWIDAATEIATRGRSGIDRGGQLARSGIIDIDAVRTAMEHPYFKLRAPKSTGRDDFPFKLLLSLTRARDASLVSTAAAVTVESIGRAYETHVIRKGLPLKRIYICGGGAKNTTLLQWLEDRLPGTRIETTEALGIEPQAVESCAFAYFGFVALHGLPLGGEWTGARGFGSPAHIIPGENWAKVLAKL